MMKILKYIGIVLTIAMMIYIKKRIDTRNKTNIQTIESFDEEENAASGKPVKISPAKK
jgi:hypothetical protein